MRTNLIVWRFAHASQDTICFTQDLIHLILPRCVGLFLFNVHLTTPRQVSRLSLS